MRKLLVIGAREHSLGDSIACVARVAGYEVKTAGVSGDEDVALNVTAWQDRSSKAVNEADHVICTAGVNEVTHPGDVNFSQAVGRQMLINVLGPLYLLDEWFATWSARKNVATMEFSDQPHSFIAISSNSARIPRSPSVGYCASKAALSMGIQCYGRALAGDRRFSVWCYEPAYIPDTPMSGDWDGARDGVLHRVPGGRLTTADAWARRIIGDLDNNASVLNGCAIRMDAEL